jgi:DNA-binding protein HU-beta
MDQDKNVVCEIRHCPACGTEIFCKTDQNDVTFYYISDAMELEIQACPGCQFDLIQVPIHALGGPPKPIEGKSQRVDRNQAGISKLTNALYQKNPEAFPTKRAAKLAFKSMGEVLFDFLSNGVDVRWTNLGGFKINKRKQRKGHNPQTGEELQIPASKGIKFVPSRALRDKLNR